MISYYKLDSKSLAFDVNKDIDLIRFNHYLMQKENIQRLKGNLKRGYLELSSKVISDDMRIDLNKAKRLVKKFLQLGIIKPINISKRKGIASVYSYSTIMAEYEPNCEPNIKPVNEPHNEPKQISNSNGFKVINEPHNEPNVKPVNEPNCEPSKIESLNISPCCCLEEPHKDLENRIVEGAYQQKMNLEDERTVLVKEYGISITMSQKKLVETMDKDVLKESIEITVAQEGKSFSYLYKVYKGLLSNKKAPVSNDNKDSKTYKKSPNNKNIIPQNGVNYKTKNKNSFKNFTETFTQYDTNELDDIISKSQKAKFKIPDVSSITFVSRI
ncbi:TPA: hypothetical protein OUL15_003762 [Clostridioides difficile]|uniref:hypothetical protein n=1 Tax=Clostridioides difficile TaxID=1496 RepID=UPI00038D2399|nr:hypothetical protein [Clostridioides difficile]AUA29379.1 hypothetical protein CWR54_10050 [Clostridioides difficile]EGT5160625.1 hypothetical protein [Clostridioides difficile]EJX2707596.1 hypothetical protein [Clostridioides difficile]ELX4543268.1 hypothetical protein [Clostridioides difficile]EQH50754.1 hypothetical protein QME_3768 [Clostridioides difficile DA00246]